MNELDTNNLETSQIYDILGKMKTYVDEIKNGEHEGELLEYKYRSKEKKIVVINIKQFIHSSIIKALIAEKSMYKWKNEHIRKEIKQEAKTVLIKRLKDNFEFSSGPAIRVLNTFLSYVKESIISGTRHYLHNLRKQNLEDNKLYKKVDKYNDDVASYSVSKLTTQSPEQLMVGEKGLNNIYNCIDELTEKQKEVLHLNSIEGISQKNIALKLGNSQQAVSKLIGKAKDNLSKLLLDKGVASKYRHYFAN